MRTVAVLGSCVALLCGCSSSAVGGSGQQGLDSTAGSGGGFSTGNDPGTTTPAPVTSTVTVTAPPPSTTTPPPGPAAVTVPSGFVGQWYGHGRSMTITSAGAVDIGFRTYVDCDATHTTGCDRTIGNEIHDGGVVHGRITAVKNSNTVTLTITSTTNPEDIPLGPTKLGHDLNHDALALFSGQFSGVPFCGSGSPSGYCGA